MNPDEIIRLYVEEKWGVPAIAKKYNTYTNKIRRLLIKSGVVMRTRSDAQKLALESGRAKIPTQGRQRTEEEKEAIRNSIEDFWKNNPEKVVEQANKSRAAWYNRDRESRLETHRLAKRGLQRTSKEGSKIERYILYGLIENGLTAESHIKELTDAEKLEVDIYVPEHKLVIEIDGPTHFRQVWDEERLLQQQQADAEKNGILINRGFKVIRVKWDCSNFSNLKARRVLNEIMENIPPKSNLIEIEADYDRRP